MERLVHRESAHGGHFRHHTLGFLVIGWAAKSAMVTLQEVGLFSGLKQREPQALLLKKNKCAGISSPSCEHPETRPSASWRLDARSQGGHAGSSLSSICVVSGKALDVCEPPFLMCTIAASEWR